VLFDCPNHQATPLLFRLPKTVYASGQLAILAAIRSASSRVAAAIEHERTAKGICKLLESSCRDVRKQRQSR
jgi:hypothetical protein